MTSRSRVWLGVLLAAALLSPAASRAQNKPDLPVTVRDPDAWSVEQPGSTSTQPPIRAEDKTVQLDFNNVELTVVIDTIAKMPQGATDTFCHARAPCRQHRTKPWFSCRPGSAGSRGGR